MESVTAVFHNGRLELAQSVDWLDGTQVEVTPVQSPPSASRLAVAAATGGGKVCELTADDDLLGEMLDDSRD